jgi:pantoate--beta-alanine ligase
LKIIHTTQELIHWRQTQSDVGVVPTMGNLHEGHLSLLQASLKDHQASVLTVFVNPTQFGPNDDFDRYPRTLKEDCEKAQSLLSSYPEKELIIFAPKSPQEIYPDGFSCQISVPKLDGFLEGAMRPHHFDGVATVVYLLFQIIKPQTAYFGRKDYQQFRLIEQMTQDLLLPIKIVGLPIIRDEDGLALSSRNQYLSNEERSAALYLSQTLQKLKLTIHNSFQNIPTALQTIEALLKDDSRWQYLEIREAKRLRSEIPKTGQIVILAVLKVGSVRLLDNIEMELK